MSNTRGMDKEDVIYIYTREYYLTIKRSDILSFALTWMVLEGMLSEITHT